MKDCIYKDNEIFNASKNINKILTIEASGIGIACIVAKYFNVPVGKVDFSKSLREKTIDFCNEAKKYDAKFIETYTTGFDKFLPYLLGKTDNTPKTPEWAAKICGIDAKTIKELAEKMYSNRTMIMAGWGIQRAHHGEQAHWMIVTLASMLGQTVKATRDMINASKKTPDQWLNDYINEQLKKIEGNFKPPKVEYDPPTTDKTTDKETAKNFQRVNGEFEWNYELLQDINKELERRNDLQNEYNRLVERGINLAGEELSPETLTKNVQAQIESYKTTLEKYDEIIFSNNSMVHIG